MGNIFKKGTQNPSISPLEITLQIRLDKTQFQVGEDVSGTVFVNILADKLNCQIRLTLKGIEKATYQWNEKNKKYEYVVKPNKFYREEFELAGNLVLFANQYTFPFTLKHQIQQPSFMFTKGTLQCSIDYFVKVKVRYGNESKLSRKISEQQILSIYPLQQNLIDFNQQLQSNKSEMLATYGCFFRKSLPVFVEISTSKTYLSANDEFQVNLSIDNKFSDCKIKTIEILFCLEFVIKAKFQAMPKYVLQREQIVEMQPGEEMMNRVFNFKISPADGLIPQSCGQKVGSRYVVILQLCFNRNFADDIDILLPVVVNTELEIPPYQDVETENQEKQKVFYLPQRLVDKKKIHKQMNHDELYSDENRIAQKSQQI